MNYKLLKGGHLPDRKCREILELFCDDLTATQIADISGVSRVTVNNYFKLIRSVIAAFCESRFSQTGCSSFFMNDEDVDEDRETSSGYYGFSLHNGKVTTSWIKGICSESIDQLMVAMDNELVNGSSNPVFERYQAIADFNDWRLYWLNNHKIGPRVINVVPEITGFWKHTKSRLQKFRGMNKSTLYLHIKECEFRYNFRNEEIITVLTGIINTRSCSKSYTVENDFSEFGVIT